MHDVFDRADNAINEEIFDDVVEIKSLAHASPSDQFHSLLVEDCSELGNTAQNNEIVNPPGNLDVQKKCVFEHLMQQFFESQHLATTPPRLTLVVLELHPPLLKHLAHL